MHHTLPWADLPTAARHQGNPPRPLAAGRARRAAPAARNKTHVNRMMAKLSARDRAQLVVIAYETGLVRPGLP